MAETAVQAARSVIETLEGALIVDASTLVEIADMCGGVLHAASPARTVRRISKDTRTLIPGDLYLALHGEKPRRQHLCEGCRRKRGSCRHP